jgi:hypothetical protein
VTEALAYVFLALDIIVGAAIVFGLGWLLWWGATRTLQTVRTSRGPQQKPPT